MTSFNNNLRITTSKRRDLKSKFAIILNMSSDGWQEGEEQTMVFAHPNDDDLENDLFT